MKPDALAGLLAAHLCVGVLGVMAQPVIDPQRFLDENRTPRETTVPQVVADLRGARVNLVEVPPSVEDELTIDEAIKKYGSASADALNGREKKLYQIALKMRREGSPGNMVIDVAAPTFSFGVSQGDALDPTVIVKTLTQLDPRYTFRIAGGTLLIFPKTLDISQTPAFKLQGVSVQDAYGQLRKEVLEPNKLTLSAQNGLLPGVADPDLRLNADVPPADLLACLTKFAEAIGPGTLWTISGPASSRRVDFFSAPQKIAGLRETVLGWQRKV